MGLLRACSRTRTCWLLGPIRFFCSSLRCGSCRVIIHILGMMGILRGAARDAAVTGVREFAGLLRTVLLRRTDVFLCPALLFYLFGLLTLVAGTLIGGIFVLPERFDPDETLALIEEHTVTVASMVPV